MRYMLYDSFKYAYEGNMLGLAMYTSTSYAHHMDHFWQSLGLEEHLVPF